MNLFQKLINYFKETRQEMRHVNWPTRQNTIRFTLLVVGVSVAVAALLGLLDILFQFLLNRFVL
ncbi:preprotein translocase subunit SecE [Candidatus Giovannonibacteria bacterium RIFCSPHIGHO2_01_FULL_48_47]|nr:MAG: preprotein translocase subunit SecE [Candidatus Giovannonibacteria bacterium RIFCSPHIGHO2_01_FULL_48_47]OGF68498.1 MAG: preprotein translocase subunit SecE [Candidatus Giovannonibacteria bacterium RIFCSPHIGHO2_02_FULL_48_15]OGF88461.1 MAG: preprotein translocase subunit SecE [Candidatus Giovannonibacteria bacterium RIFCSPLOWO2_01_FULL_48_47]OGF96509.1 MAG: preprotein translocase subunit SecE [Candidatus Giovannonibacteria bacterium RIFOXYD1_FULL_48_21]HBT81183.1 preprotein translocase s